MYGSTKHNLHDLSSDLSIGVNKISDYNTHRLFYVASCMDNSDFYINILQRIPLYKHV